MMTGKTRAVSFFFFFFLLISWSLARETRERSDNRNNEKVGQRRISEGEFFVNANWSLAFEPPLRFPSRFLFLLLNRKATMFKYRWKDPKSMLLKVVKIIGRIYFRPGRFVSFFSVPTITTLLFRSFGSSSGTSWPIIRRSERRRERPKFYFRQPDTISRDKLG